MATSDNNKPVKEPASSKSPAANADQPVPKEGKEKRTAIFPGDVAPEAT